MGRGIMKGVKMGMDDSVRKSWLLYEPVILGLVGLEFWIIDLPSGAKT